MLELGHLSHNSMHHTTPMHQSMTVEMDEQDVMSE